jgi:hypothetical protein
MLVRSSSPRRALTPALLWLVGACGSVPNDPGARLFLSKGVIRGTVVYQGPRPCSRLGHIVGNAIVLVFDRRNPPPPDGLASTAVNFADVTGDVLFANEPRYTGPDTYCPLQSGFVDTLSTSAPFQVAPLDGGSYEIRAFFDYTGNFLPEFKIRNLPERGDIGGGYVDTADALKAINAGNPDYKPRYLPVDIGTAPTYVVPERGFVADGVTVTIGAPLHIPRPYFYAQGEQVEFDLANPTGLSSSVTQSSGDPATDANGDDVPILKIPQDIDAPAPPINPTPASEFFYESKFLHLRLAWGVPDSELALAVGAPFQLQVAPPGQGGGFFVWQDANLDPAAQMYLPQQIPEGNGVPQLWPQVVLTRQNDPSSASHSVVVLEGITLLGGMMSDSLLGTSAGARDSGLFDKSAPSGPRPFVFNQDHLTVMLRPSVICFPSPTDRGTLVLPHPMGTTADIDCSSIPCTAAGMPDQPVAPLDLVAKLASVVEKSVIGCLPMGRYAINVVYPDGQAWTVPNESGVCAPGEACSQRPILSSQGRRAVVEIAAAQDVAYCDHYPAPPECGASP